MADLIDGRRIDISDEHPVLLEGEYGKHPYDNSWYCCPPGWGHVGGLRNHKVVEHEDGTITVSPSILIKTGDGEVYWHGFLEHGKWRKC